MNSTQVSRPKRRQIRTHKDPERQALFRVWKSMRKRCNNPKAKGYANYGGRGIAVEWQSFDAFLASMGRRPAGAMIERIDNDGPYASWNCRWASRDEQARNTRAVVLNAEAVKVIRHFRGRISPRLLGALHKTVPTNICNVQSGRSWTDRAPVGESTS